MRRFVQIVIFSIIFFVYAIVIIFLLHGLKNANDLYVGKASLINGIVTSISTLILGILTVIQSQKYKRDSDERNETPILAVGTQLYGCEGDIYDVICSIGNNPTYKINMYVCSFNKSVTNFSVKSIKLKEKRFVEKEWDAISVSKDKNSKYNGIFLQDKFYYICILCPEPKEGCYLEIECLFCNIYLIKYVKTLVLVEKNGKWELEKTSKCKKGKR